MSGFLTNLVVLYRAQLQRRRNRPLLRAAVAACALVSVAGGVSLCKRVRLDQVLETLDALQIFDPHEGVELFDELVETLRNTTLEKGRRLILDIIDEEIAREPEQAELLIRLCLAVSGHDGAISSAEGREILVLCRHLHAGLDICSQLGVGH